MSWHEEPLEGPVPDRKIKIELTVSEALIKSAEHPDLVRLLGEDAADAAYMLLEEDENG